MSTGLLNRHAGGGASSHQPISRLDNSKLHLQTTARPSSGPATRLTPPSPRCGGPARIHRASRRLRPEITEEANAIGEALAGLVAAERDVPAQPLRGEFLVTIRSLAYVRRPKPPRLGQLNTSEVTHVLVAIQYQGGVLGEGIHPVRD